MRQQKGATLLPIEPQSGHLRLERLCVAVEARIDQDQPVRRFDHVSSGRAQLADQMYSRDDRNGGTV